VKHNQEVRHVKKDKRTIACIAKIAQLLENKMRG
jgi:hypothetical protein